MILPGRVIITLRIAEVNLRKPIQYISVEDYLEGEKESPIRHEYVDGHVFAMAGSSDRHNRVAINLTSRLNGHLTEGLRRFHVGHESVGDGINLLLPGCGGGL